MTEFKTNFTIRSSFIKLEAEEIFLEHLCNHMKERGTRRNHTSSRHLHWHWQYQWSQNKLPVQRSRESGPKTFLDLSVGLIAWWIRLTDTRRRETVWKTLTGYPEVACGTEHGWRLNGIAPWSERCQNPSSSFAQGTSRISSPRRYSLLIPRRSSD